MFSKDEGKKDKMVKRDTTTLIEPGRFESLLVFQIL